MKRVLGVKFRVKFGLGEKAYNYFTDNDDIEVGDWVDVVVQDAPVTVCVVSAVPAAPTDSYKWIANKIDLSDYYFNEEHRKAIADIERKLEDAMMSTNKYAMYAKYAETNPEIKRLLDTLTALTAKK